MNFLGDFQAMYPPKPKFLIKFYDGTSTTVECSTRTEIYQELWEQVIEEGLKPSKIYDIQQIVLQQTAVPTAQVTKELDYLLFGD